MAQLIYCILERRWRQKEGRFTEHDKVLILTWILCATIAEVNYKNKLSTKMYIQRKFKDLAQKPLQY